MRQRKNRLSVTLSVAGLLLAWLLLCGQTGPGGASLRGPHHVLFLGNSLTYTNQMPLIVEALARSRGDQLEVSSVTLGGANLEDLWHDGSALREIDRGGWTVVVLQQGPSSLLESRIDLRKWTRNFAQRIRKVGARPAMYMVWPEKERIGVFDQVSESYALAAADVKGILFPAGETWRAAWRRDPSAPLYGSDGFHPSAAGSYAAALSIYGMLSRMTVQGLPARLRLRDGSVIDIPPNLAALLQEAANEANQKFGKP
jgi:hypothetical protein